MNFSRFEIKRIVALILPLGVICLAWVALQRSTEHITLSMVKNALQQTSLHAILFALIATLVSYTAIAANEIIAVGTLSHNTPPWRFPILAGTIGNAFGNTLGFHTLTVSAWRYRIYKPLGLTIFDIARVTGVTFLSIILGFAGIAAYALVFGQSPGNANFLGSFICRLSGTGLLFSIISFLIWAAKKPRHIQLGKQKFTLPTPIGLIICGIGCVDISATIYAAYILLPADITFHYTYFSLLFIGAVLFGIASHTPGGIGIFEAAMITGLGAGGRVDVLAGLLFFRIIYNWLPFVFSCMCAIGQMLFTRHQLDRG